MKDKLFGRFEVERELGRGSLGRVLLARDTRRDGERVAVKVLDAESLGEAGLRFLRNEFKVLRGLEHPGLAKALDLGESKDRDGAFLVQEYIEGPDLLEASKGVDGRQIARWGLQIARALAYLHGHGVVHGDIKPQNVLVREQGPVLIDFCLASAAGSGAEGLRGTIHYMAPELLKGASHSPRSDLYALGALLFQALAGRLPYEADSLAELLKEIRTAPPASVRRISPEVEQGLGDVVDKLLARDPSSRYQAASGAARDMASFLGEAPDIKASSTGFIPLVGRGETLDKLKGWVNRSLSGKGGSAFIQGRRGMGASRLLREIADYARTEGINVGEARFAESLGPYGSLISLIENMSGGGIDAGPAPAEADEQAWRLFKYRLWSAAGALLEKIAGEGPLMLALDDFEFSPNSARELVRYLVSRFEGARGVLFIAAGDDAGGAVPWGERFELAPLSLEGVSEFAREIWGEAPSERVAQTLLDASGGNPLCLREMLKSLPPGATPAEGDIPESIEELMASSLGRLTPEAVQLLEALAVWGGPAECEDISRLTDRSVEDIYAEFRFLEEEGLVSRREGLFDLAWPLFREFIEQSAAIGARRKLHKRAAEALASRVETDPMATARHFLGANDPDGGAEWALKAGEALRNMGANREAAQLCGRAVEIVEKSDSRLAPLLEEWGKSAALAGLHDQALAAWRQRLELGEQDPPSMKAFFHLEMARCQQRKGEYERAERAIGRSEAQLAERPDNPVFLQALELRAMLNLARGKYEDARQTAEKAIKLIESAKESANGGRRTMNPAPFLAALGLSHTFTGEYDKAVECFEKAIEMYSQEGDAPRKTLALSSLGVALQHRGDTAQALERYRLSYELARQIGDLRAQATMAMNMASIEHQEGRYGDGALEYRRALRLARQIGAEADIARIENNLGNLLVYLGRPEEARRFIDSSIVKARQLGLKPVEAYNHMLRGDILKMRGEMLGARKEYRRARRKLSKLGCAREVVQVDLRLAALYTDMGERERAEAAASEALGGAQKLAIRPFEAEALLARARIALKRGDTKGALSYSRSAAAMAEGENHSAPLMWEIKALMGAALVRAGAREDGLSLLEDARSIAVELRDSLPEKYRDGFLSGPRWDALSEDLARAKASDDEATGPGERWEKLLDVNRRLNIEHDLDRLLELIMDSVLSLIKAERGFLILNRGGKLDVMVARNIDRESIGRAKGKISRSIAEEVCHTGKPLITVDARADERFDKYASVHELKLRSVLCIPFRVKDKVVGTLYVDNRFQSGAFGDEDLMLMEAFADQAAIAIENARLIEENELKRKQIEASHRRIEALVDELEQKVDRQGREISDLHKDLDRAPAGPTKYQYTDIIGESRAMRRVFAMMDRVTESSAPVLIEGESGAGKELVARAIHFNGSRTSRRFLGENCSAIPETLLESELFGHEKGAFTGASERKIGVFEAADGGTIFLDEIGDMSLGMQSKLLRALQEGEIRRVGGEKVVHVDVRVISATHQSLEELIRQGRFREDLYWRLNVVKIVLPPLRERLEDVPLLVGHFIGLLEGEIGKKAKVAPEAMRLLVAYDWPGNVRELENEIRKAAIMSDGDIGPDNLSPRIKESMKFQRDALSPSSAKNVEPGLTMREAVEQFEKQYLERVIEECGGNRAKAAKKLGIARRTLYDKLARYGIEPERG